MSKRKIVYLNLHGGLGNQLFQFAAAYAYARKNGRELHVLYKPKPDSYGRTLLVDQLLSHQIRREIVFQSKTELGIALRLGRKIRRKIFPATFIQEDVASPHKDNQLDEAPPNGSVELFGFWQDEEFFLPIVEHLRDNLEIDIALDPPYEELYHKINNSNSVCVGVRLYEDNGDDHTPEAEASFRDLIERAERLESQFPEAQFFVFSSSENEILEEICGGRGNYRLARAKDGMTDTLQTLKLMAHCRHHIFNQSTYYWWAAWLSENLHGIGQTTISSPEKLFCASRSGIPQRWIESAKKLNNSITNHPARRS